MADSTIPNSFKVAFDDQVKLVYQDKGARLKACVRTKSTDGTEETFYRLGKGEAVTKERGAKIPRMNLDRIPTKVKLQKIYASEAIDDLDTYVQAYDEMGKLAESVVMAVARKQDNLIKEAIELKATEVDNVIKHNNVGWTMDKIKKLHKHWGEHYIFDSGSGTNYIFTSSVGFQDMLELTTEAGGHAVSNSQFIGIIPPEQMPFRLPGMRGFSFFGFEWYTWDSLNKDDSNTRFSLAFNSECVAFAEAKAMSTKIYMDDNTDEHVVKASNYAGSGVIDETGIMVIETKEA